MTDLTRLIDEKLESIKSNYDFMDDGLDAIYPPFTHEQALQALKICIVSLNEIAEAKRNALAFEAIAEVRRIVGIQETK